MVPRGTMAKSKQCLPPEDRQSLLPVFLLKASSFNAAVGCLLLFPCEEEKQAQVLS